MHHSDAGALMPAIESVEKQNLKPKEVTADALYGSDENWECTKQQSIELIASTMGSVDKEKLSLADFQFSEKGDVIVCLQGIHREKSKKEKSANICTTLKLLAVNIFRSAAVRVREMMPAGAFCEA